jgi:hypothetical protein
VRLPRRIEVGKMTVGFAIAWSGHCGSLEIGSMARTQRPDVGLRMNSAATAAS